MEFKILFLAGGYGTRLGYNGPKALVKLNGEKTIIDYLVNELKKQGFNEFIISTNEKFENHFKNWLNKNNLEAILVIEPHNKNKDKFGAIKGLQYVYEKIPKLNNHPVILVLPDNLFLPNPPIKELVESYKDGEIILVAHKYNGNDIFRFGQLKVNDGKVIEFGEKKNPPISNLILTGLLILPPGFKQIVDEYLNFHYQNSKAKDSPGFLIEYLVNKGHNLKAVIFEGEWFDIGTPQSLERVRNLLQKKQREG